MFSPGPAQTHPPLHSSSVGLSRLDQSVQSLFARGVAPSTANAYSAGWTRFLNFCNCFRLALLPLREDTLCRFVALLASESIRHTTIVSYISACRYAQISAGLPDPLLPSLPRLTYVRRGSLLPRVLWIHEGRGIHMPVSSPV